MGARLILNLKPLNEFEAYYHFKMDTLHAALKLMRPGCFMASVDLKDAYYSIPVAEEDQIFLTFEWGVYKTKTEDQTPKTEDLNLYSFYNC